MTAAPGGVPGALRGRARRLGALPRAIGGAARRHRSLTALLAAGLALRIAAVLAYYPALLYIDSFGYLGNLYRLDTTGRDPIGYSLFLRPLLAVSNLTTVAVLQHLMGLGIAVAVYALLRRYRVRGPLAALAVAPVLLDGYQVQIEQNILSDTLFEALVVAGIAVLAWHRRPRPAVLATGALLFGCAAVVRSVGDALLLVALLFPPAVVRGARRRIAAVAVCAAGFAVPILGQAAWSEYRTGQPALSGQGGYALYGRTATIADCGKLPLTAAERPLCPAEPVTARRGVDYYVNNPGSPLQQLQAQAGQGQSQPDPERVATGFAQTVIENQPWDFAAAVGSDILHGFSTGSHTSSPDIPASRWQFQTSYPIWLPQWDSAATAQVSQQFGQGPPAVRPLAAQALRSYQLDGGSTPGPLLGVFALLAFGGSVAWSRRVRASGLRTVTVLFASAGLGLVFLGDLYEYSVRYQLPGIVLLPAAGALGLTGLTWWRRPLLAPYPDDADRAAVRAFRREYGEHLRFAPVTVVIAAYNEEDAIGPVLRRVPKASLGMLVDTLVVVDGASDGTAEAARAEPPAYVCETPVNRGQGAALRLGYRLASDGGARYIVTTDADGQYDIEELDRMLRPLVEDRADFVTGSRVLGSQETGDLVRRSGVHVFAWLVGFLTRHKTTDTSFGLRAMRSEVTAAVTLEQPQYQSSELLISTLAAGFRVAEIPMVMRVRAAGRSKKGNNAVYGFRYARVVVRTWWRERRSAKTSPSKTRNFTTNMAP